jgi:hypothetical protein
VQVLGSTELRTIELPDQLQFIYGYQAGWGDLVAPPAALLAALIWAWTTGHHIFVAIFIVIFGGLAFYWINITPTHLSVSIRELVSRGNHNRNIKAEVTVPASDIQSLDYFPAGPSAAAGLYAQCGQRQILLMPGLTKGQASEVVNTIRARFPQIEQSNSTRTSPGYSEPASGAYVSLTGLPPSQPKP